MSTPTSGGASESVGLAPNYYMHVFPNGLRMVGQHMPSLASVTFGFQVPAGIRDEPESRLGLTYLLADMMFQGTQSRNVRQLTEAFEAIGARKGGENAMEFSRYSAQIVANRMDAALELFADVMLHPVIPEDEFQQMRAVQLQDIRRRDDEPMRRIFDLVRERFFAGSHLGRRSLGLRETVEALTADDLRGFYRPALQARRRAVRHRRGLRLGPCGGAGRRALRRLGGRGARLVHDAARAGARRQRRADRGQPGAYRDGVPLPDLRRP